MDINITGTKNRFAIYVNREKLSHKFDPHCTKQWMQEITGGSPWEDSHYWFIVESRGRTSYTKDQYRMILMSAVKWILTCD